MTHVANRLMTGLRAFREAYMISGMEGFGEAQFSSLYDFESREARVTRYDILWAYYQNNVYRRMHKWAEKMKVDYGLYPYIRGIYNPANRICNFHQTHIWGGHLDRDAGDGSEIPTAIPIESANDPVRRATSDIWRWSRWHVVKDIVPLYGAVYGDVFLRVAPVPERDMLFLERVHPGWIAEVEVNGLDEIEYYSMEYRRRDPEKTDGSVATYREDATLVDGGGSVVYQTWREGQPYDWTGQGEEWVVEVPFIPMVHIRHNDVGIPWGWSEMFPALSKFRELDDQASKLSDQIRKLVDSPWMFSGVNPGKTGGTIQIEGSGSVNPTGAPSEISREETPIFFAHDPGARPHPLVAPMDLEGAISHIKELQEEIEKSYPELRSGVGRGGGGRGEVSGRALLIARQAAEDKVNQRRVNYDEKLVSVLKMAMAIGGDMGLQGFEGFDLESVFDDDFDLRIQARRPVFTPHPTEVLDQERQLWTNAHLAERVGVSLPIFLADKDWATVRIDEILEDEQYKAHVRQLIAQAELIEEQAAQTAAAASDEEMNDEDTRGDTSGRGALAGGQDFNVAERVDIEG